MSRAITPLKTRFLAKVKTSGPIPAKRPELGPCWVWVAFLSPLGYGQILGNKRKLLLAHRAAWIIYIGDIPNSIFVLHHCDNPACVNPKHLFLGTQRDNIRDMVSKDRERFGERATNLKLRFEQVLKILSDTRRQRAIAADYGICQQTVCKIKQGRSWRKALQNAPSLRKVKE